ncbi:50S ribosomal protein L6 [Aerococcus kribbianus]|uniref:Large ribosomal subunit protein uL6 n=1 Tax=Aerococcus kribbianus TaxID=2999064 RepID=A0A9X3FPI3_9LACT|nr:MULTISPECIES: 50S ribosomal protein L6 [unclassified Aerococcus]MCZ0718069.1 50S ribosomal protein L6 [Aerococcus sp. YH-aer221]MCZ0726362.1 50S ribosomal protein L6 [Aerococcus sp. YH-aer222]
MSRIGNRPVELPSNVTLDIDGNTVTVKGPKGELTQTFSPVIEMKVDDNIVTFERPNDNKAVRSIHGTTRALFNNMVVGVSEGFTKELEMVGVGYRAQMSGDKLVVNVGLSHPVEFEVPEGIEIEVPSNTQIKVKGISKEAVGQLAAEIRATRLPEPYKGKGVRYVGEYVRRKEGKTGK